VATDDHRDDHHEKEERERETVTRDLLIPTTSNSTGRSIVNSIVRPIAAGERGGGGRAGRLYRRSWSPLDSSVDARCCYYCHLLASQQLETRIALELDSLDSSFTNVLRLEHVSDHVLDVTTKCVSVVRIRHVNGRTYERLLVCLNESCDRFEFCLLSLKIEAEESPQPGTWNVKAFGWHSDLI